jgi:DNA-directed RNA polymerase specialized sigma24 family protein
MGSKCDKADAKKLKVLKGGHQRDIYEDAKWRKRPIDIDGEQYTGIPVLEQEEWYEEKLRSKAKEVVNQMTTDLVERSIAELMLENYTEKEIAEMLNISLARVEWFMRKIQGWKRKEGMR